MPRHCCTLCDKSYPRSDNLRRHIILKHNRNPPLSTTRPDSPLTPEAFKARKRLADASYWTRNCAISRNSRIRRRGLIDNSNNEGPVAPDNLPTPPPDLENEHDIMIIDDNTFNNSDAEVPNSNSDGNHSQSLEEVEFYNGESYNLILLLLQPIWTIAMMTLLKIGLVKTITHPPRLNHTRMNPRMAL
jgi:hypothetical protein